MNVHKFLQEHVVAHLPELTLRGRLIRYAPVEHLLRGFWVETSTFREGKFSITAFVQVMAVPATSIVLSFGQRLGDGSDKWWTLTEGHEGVIAQDVLKRLRTKEGDFFSRMRNLSDFVSVYSPPNQETNDTRLTEARFYALVLLGRDAEATRLVEHLGTNSDDPAWQVQLIERLTQDAADLATNRSQLLQRIAVQEELTSAALRVE